MSQKRIRLIVDIVMIVVLPLLMAYSLVGEKNHEILGSLMLILSIIHHVLNRKWYRALPKGKYGVKRIIRTVLDVLLLVIMFALPISGILMSKHLYTFIHIRGVASTSRELHLLLSYWGLVLMCIHAGTHLVPVVGKLLREKRSARIAVYAVWCAVSGYGAYVFVRRSIHEYMFRKTMFAFIDTSESKAVFFLDYAAVMLLFMFVGYILFSEFRKKETNTTKV
ncbi:MAG: DUF4405 domain-containing protein [Clostridiales bacterium]|nr:DUF4405 domain-containing protein [Clostridiales bacterium]